MTDTQFLGGLAEQMGNLDDAMASYERALRTNPNSISAMNAMSSVLRTREDFPKAAEYLNAILKLDEGNGDAWGSLGTRTCCLAFLNGSVHYANSVNRTLLPDDGRPTTSVQCLSKGDRPTAEPKGLF